MASSSSITSTRTSKFRAQVLEAAGIVFRTLNHEPHVNATDLHQQLLSFSPCITPEQARTMPIGLKLPVDSIGPVPAFSDAMLDTLVTKAVAVAQAAESLLGDGSADNESQWKMVCHNQALEMIAAADRTVMSINGEQLFPSCTVGETVLYSNRPDYTCSLRVNPVPSRPFLSARSLRRLVTESFGPFASEDHRGVFPIAVAESRSFFGIKNDAENQCAESAIKMLRKLRSLGGAAVSLPVMCCSLYGSLFTIYLVCCDDEPGAEGFLMQTVWESVITDYWHSLQFQMMLWRFSLWWLNCAIPAIQSSVRQRRED